MSPRKGRHTGIPDQWLWHRVYGGQAEEEKSPQTLARVRAWEGVQVQVVPGLSLLFAAPPLRRVGELDSGARRRRRYPHLLSCATGTSDVTIAHVEPAARS